MNEFTAAFLVGECFLLSFLLYFFPLKQNAQANKWLSFFIFILGTAFNAVYLEKVGLADSLIHLIKLINSLQFLLAPSLYLSILYFVNPTNNFKIRYWLHFLPFTVFSVFENLVFWSETSLSTKLLFQLGDFEFWVRDLLPFLMLGYVALGLVTLNKHEANLKFIASTTQNSNLKWLKRFLWYLILLLAFWIYDALSIFSIPFLLKLTGFIYAGSIFFLAFNAFRQGVIFPYKNDDLAEISDILQINDVPLSDDKTKSRLTDEQIAELTARLKNLMEVERIYLENELNLPAVAAKLEISIHDASYLINHCAGDNFYNFINRYRVEEAKRLLTSANTKNLKMLGIAFASGFNSKTAFNTAFKKWVGVSPSEYAQKQENH